MKYLVLLLLSVTSNAESLDLTKQDKQLHVAASFGATMAAERLYSHVNPELSPFLAFGTVMVVGIAKEVFDPKFSKADVSANFIGCIWGTVFTASF